MRKAFILFAIAGALVSCNKVDQEENFVELGDIISLSKTFTVADVATKAGETTECRIVLDADYSVSEDKIVDLSVSFADGVDFEGMTGVQLMDLFDEKMREELGADYLELAALEDPKTTSSNNGLATCLRNCKESHPDHTKGDGRGACRFDCWFKAVIEVLKVIPPVIGIFID